MRRRGCFIPGAGKGNCASRRRHSSASRLTQNLRGANPNDALFAPTVQSKRTRCELGLDQHLAEFAAGIPATRAPPWRNLKLSECPAVADHSDVLGRARRCRRVERLVRSLRSLRNGHPVQSSMFMRSPQVCLVWCDCERRRGDSAAHRVVPGTRRSQSFAIVCRLVPLTACCSSAVASGRMWTWCACSPSTTEPQGFLRVAGTDPPSTNAACSGAGQRSLANWLATACEAPRTGCSRTTNMHTRCAKSGVGLPATIVATAVGRERPRRSHTRGETSGYAEGALPSWHFLSGIAQAISACCSRARTAGASVELEGSRAVHLWKSP